MAIGGVAGLVDGFTRGYGLSRQWAREDEERKAREEERAYLKEQRDRLRKQQADEDAVADALKGVQRTSGADGWGEGYDWARQNQAATRDDEGNMMPGVATVQVPRSQRDILADQARAVAGIGGLRGAQLGLQFQQGVDALDEVQRVRAREAAADARQRRLDDEAGIDREARRRREAMQDRQARVLEGMRNSRLLLANAGNDPERLAAVARHMQGVYEGVPDGRQLVIKNGTLGVATPDGKWVFQPVPINRENLESSLAYAERYLDPNWAERKKVEDQSAYWTGLLAAKKREDDREDADAPFRRGLWGAQANYYNSGGGRREATEKPTQWELTERRLIADGYSDADIRRARTEYDARRGIAPPSHLEVLRSGKKPDGKTPLTRADVDEFNRRYPNSKVDPKTLPWLQGK